MDFLVQLNHEFVPTKEIDNGKIVKNPEIPDRLRKIENYVLSEDIEILESSEFNEDVLYLAHKSEYVKYLKEKCQTLGENDEYLPEVFFVDRIFDTGTPLKYNTFEVAKRAVDTTLSGVLKTLEKKVPVYVLTRPPGHHAMKSYGGGYCYFNNVAIAGKYLKTKGIRSAILDIDFHHGNGTQDIFYDDRDVLYVSIHGTPKIFYPWYCGFEYETGIGPAEGTNKNIPLPGGATWDIYKPALEEALKTIEDFKPDFLIVSVGYDTHVKDPVGHFALQDKDYKEIGIALSKIYEKIGFICFVQEGGYNVTANYKAFLNLLEGFEGTRR